MSTSNIPRDGNRVPLLNPEYGLVVVSSPSAFTGGSANTRGDFDGTGNPTTLFTVTGKCLIRIYGVCTVDLEGAAATLEVGITGSTARLIAQTTATNIDNGESWFSNTPAFGVPLSSLTQYAVQDTSIIETVGTANITAGQIYYVCMYYPLTSGSRVEAA